MIMNSIIAKIQSIILRLFKKTETESENITVEVKTRLKNKTIILKHRQTKVGENEIQTEIWIFEKNSKKIENEDLLQLSFLFNFFEENKIISKNFITLQKEQFGEVDEDFFLNSCSFIIDFLFSIKETDELAAQTKKEVKKRLTQSASHKR